MSQIAGARPPTRLGPWGAALAVTGTVLALALGIAAGDPSPASMAPGLVILGIAAIVLTFTYPFWGFLALATSTIILLVFDLPGGQGLNPFDLLLPCLMLASVFGTARADADAADRAVTDPRRLEVLQATQRLTRAVLAFYVVALLSIVAMVCVGRLAPLATSVTTMLRGVQGLLLFPLGVWWLRSEERIHMTIRAMIVGGILIVVLNCVALGMGVAGRAGMIWFVNQTEAPVAGPNEAASTLVLLAALLLVRQTVALRARNLVLLGVLMGILVATLSRSGLLAMLTFTAMVMPRARARWVVLALFAVLIALPFVPADYWTRIGRTLVMKRGTFEAYTSLIRVYGWKTALNVFIHQPLLGVGFVAYSSVSGDYGELRISGVPVDNFYLETAAGMGLPGLIALAFVIVRMFQLGAVVRRHVPAGGLAHAMARYHTPLWIGMLIVNLTGNNFIGIVVLGQVALWSAMLVRSAHMAIESRTA